MSDNSLDLDLSMSMFAFNSLLDLYLYPYRTKHRPLNHWVVILSPPGNSNCTFYHIRAVKGLFDMEYKKIASREPIPLHSLPITAGEDMEKYLMGRIDQSRHGEIIRVLNKSLTEASETSMPWALTFLHMLEEEKLVPAGMWIFYDRLHGEAETDFAVDKSVAFEKLVEKMQDLGLDARVSKDEFEKLTMRVRNINLV
ncbi:hypothetical protein ASPVEDRAFT_79729 [Aspergillus versicolor CBS 583.65]|uniref:Uncharacterized protein n=1 Tax=Aspergillus versicolor CBS 583.65 TaxID=1036611 RepID=A0A1L9P9B0_ASPVE|nr:uncharacterized protein ASPVEDRAFT_79729 [Aspergillus versicolor CBS 583.65]OJI98063.1 hypothetical protein ASPVEDRAFT_79729 [Aspergillus versicolor CBS 583.65]